LNQAFTDNFWDTLQSLVSDNQIIIDRPKGSAHPRYPEMIYPLDYGYLQGTRTTDRDGVDLFLGLQASQNLSGVLFTVDLDKKDVELKLLLGCSASEQHTVADFLSSNRMGVTIFPAPHTQYEGGNHGSESLLTWLSSRRSIRRFEDRSIPTHLIDCLLEVATSAPSAHNQQPWRFVVLQSPEARQLLATYMGEAWQADLLSQGLTQQSAREQIERSSQRICSAPLGVLLCLDTSDLKNSRDDNEITMAVQSVALAGGTLLLAAHACGLGAVWLCAPLFAPQAVHQAAKDNLWQLPQQWQPQALILLGYPAKPARHKYRRNIDEISIII
jgi:F420 biosynthesis protein FbiB-like protein